MTLIEELRNFQGSSQVFATIHRHHLAKWLAEAEAMQAEIEKLKGERDTALALIEPSRRRVDALQTENTAMREILDAWADLRPTLVPATYQYQAARPAIIALLRRTDDALAGEAEGGDEQCAD